MGLFSLWNYPGFLQKHSRSSATNLIDILLPTNQSFFERVESFSNRLVDGFQFQMMAIENYEPDFLL